VLKNFKAAGRSLINPVALAEYALSIGSSTRAIIWEYGKYATRRIADLSRISLAYISVRIAQWSIDIYEDLD